MFSNFWLFYSGFEETTDGSSPVTTLHMTSYMTSLMTSESSTETQLAITASTEDVVTSSDRDTGSTTIGESTAAVTSPVWTETTSGSAMTSPQPPSLSTVSAIMTTTATNERKISIIIIDTRECSVCSVQVTFENICHSVSP